MIVFNRAGGLTGADLRAIGRIGDGLNRLKITGATPIIDPFSADSEASLGGIAKIADGIGPISRDGEAALVVLAINAGERGAIVDRGADDPRLPRGAPAPRPRRLRDRARRDRRRPRAGRGRSRQDAADRDPQPGPAPAAGRLPGAAAGRRAAARRRRRLHGRDRNLLPADRGRRDHGQHRGHLLTPGAGLRRRHRLLAAARPPLPRGAAKRQAPPRRPPHRAEREHAGDRRLGRDRDRGDAGPAGRRPAVDPLARADPGDRDRGDAERRLHPAAGAALGRRRARLLAGIRRPAAIARFLWHACRRQRNRGMGGTGSPGWCGGARGRSSCSSAPA